MLITFVSAKGSPGVTTTALAFAAAWPRTAFVVDADPAGGDIAAGLGGGTWPTTATLLELAALARSLPVEDAVRSLAIRPAAHAPLVLAGLGSPAQAPTLPWPDLAHGFRRVADADVLCDAGRYLHADCTADLLRGSDVVVLVTRSSLPAVRATARLVDVLRTETLTNRAAPQLLVVDPGHPYNSYEITKSCGLPLLGALPDDPFTAAVWSAGRTPGRHLARSALSRAMSQLAPRLTKLREATTS